MHLSSFSSIVNHVRAGHNHNFSQEDNEYSFQQPTPPPHTHLKEYSQEKNDDFQFKLKTVLY